MRAFFDAIGRSDSVRRSEIITGAGAGEDRDLGHHRWNWLYLLCVSVLGIFGLASAVLGAQVALLGGTLYFLLLGLLLLFGNLLAWLNRHRASLLAVGAALILTLFWSIFEIHGKGWLPTWGL